MSKRTAGNRQEGGGVDGPTAEEHVQTSETIFFYEKNQFRSLLVSEYPTNRGRQLKKKNKNKNGRTRSTTVAFTFNYYYCCHYSAWCDQIIDKRFNKIYEKFQKHAHKLGILSLSTTNLPSICTCQVPPFTTTVNLVNKVCVLRGGGGDSLRLCLEMQICLGFQRGQNCWFCSTSRLESDPWAREIREQSKSLKK